MLTQLSPRERLFYFLALVGSLCVFGFVGAQYLKKPSEIILRPLEPQAEQKMADSSEVVVHVVSAVRTPGLFRLAAGSRVVDAIARAGGSTNNADLESINLAAKLIDGSQLRVPRKGTSEAEAVVDAYKGGGPEVYYPQRSSSNAALRSSGSPSAGSVSLNSASQAQFESLPQIGPATARKILDYRKSTGGFSSIEELLKVNGIGPKKLAAIRKYVRL